MRCDELENRLNEALDRRDDPQGDPEIAAHIARCRACRAVVDDYACLNTALATFRPVRSASDDRRFSRRRAVATLLTVAAAIVVSLSIRSPQANWKNNPAPESASKSLEAESSASRSVRRASPVAMLAERTGRAYVDWVQDTVRSLDDAILMASTLPPPDALFHPLLFSENGILKRWGDNLTPVAGETLDAVEQLFSDDSAARS